MYFYSLRVCGFPQVFSVDGCVPKWLEAIDLDDSAWNSSGYLVAFHPPPLLPCAR